MNESFFVHGLPAPQGSKSAFVRGGRAVIVDASSKTGREKHHNWRNDVMVGATKMLEQGCAKFTGPTGLRVDFYLPLPKSDQHRTRHISAPDLDKLVRSVGDALTNSGIVSDDSVFCEILATKQYARDTQPIGALIRLTDLSGYENDDRVASKALTKQRKKLNAR